MGIGVMCAIDLLQPGENSVNTKQLSTVSLGHMIWGKNGGCYLTRLAGLNPPIQTVQVCFTPARQVEF